MSHARTMPLMLLLSACAYHSTPLEISRFQSELPEFGLTRGPDGWYLTRSNSPFGTEGRAQIWRYPFDGSEPSIAAFFAHAGSVSDFSYSHRYQQAFYVIDGDIHSAKWHQTDGWQSGPNMDDLNTPGYEASPHLAPDGSIYFASQREGGVGQGDIYRAKPSGEGWEIELLGPEVNSTTGEWNLALSDDGQIMVFEASGRATNRTVPGDFYLSCLVDGVWQAAKPMDSLNTDDSDLDFRFTGRREGVFSTAKFGGDAVLRFAGPENFADCE